MQELQVFNNPTFGEVRTITIDSKTLFCGYDVARSLGYCQPHKAIHRHCRYGTKYTVPHPQSSGKTIEMLFIPEGDVYRLSASSELPGAEKFESWIFDKVLPSIRKHGAYMTPETLEAAILNPDTMIKLCTALKDEQEKNERLTAQVKQQKQTIGELKPKAIYYDSILANPGLVTITQIAKDYGMSGKKLNKLLHECGIQYKINGQWLLYAKYHDCGYTHSETVEFEHTDGRKDVTMITKWTQKGRLFLYELLKQNGYLPSIEQPRDRITREISYPLRGIHEIFVL